MPTMLKNIHFDAIASRTLILDLMGITIVSFFLFPWDEITIGENVAQCPLLTAQPRGLTAKCS